MLFQFTCDYCERKRQVQSNFPARLPDGWIELRRQDGNKSIVQRACSIDCAMTLLADYADELEQRYGWV